jgi:hypothetical protein
MMRVRIAVVGLSSAALLACSGGRGSRDGAAGDASLAAAGNADAANAGAGGAGTAGTAGAGVAGTAGSAGTAGTTDAAGAAGSAGMGEPPAPGSACGKDPPASLIPGMLVMQTMMTMGVKDANCADSQCGAWSDTRNYYVRLPQGYDKNQAYPLVLEGPGCGGQGYNLYGVPSFNSTVIRVGLTPSAYWQRYHATNPNQGCFDDKEGDDSVDFVFYEKLYDQLAGTLCFDRDRVFAAGNSSGSWLANELGCKYATDAKRPIRGVLTNGGGLPTDPRFTPTCTKSPMAGFWSGEVPNPVTPFSSVIVAMDRALTVNGCTPAGVTYETATFDPFPIGGGNPDGVCKRYQGCPDTAPLVVCPIPYSSQKGGQDNIVNPGWPAFLKLFDSVVTGPNDGGTTPADASDGGSGS